MPRHLHENFRFLSNVSDSLIEQEIYPVFMEREHIEGGITTPVIHKLQKYIHKYGFSKVAGRTLIHYSGYSEDPRELFEIPEARTFWQQLNTAFPAIPTLINLAISLTIPVVVPSGKGRFKVLENCVPPVYWNGPIFWLGMLANVDTTAVSRIAPDTVRFEIKDAAVWLAKAAEQFAATYQKYGQTKDKMIEAFQTFLTLIENDIQCGASNVPPR